MPDLTPSFVRDATGTAPPPPPAVARPQARGIDYGVGHTPADVTPSRSTTSGPAGLTSADLAWLDRLPAAGEMPSDDASHLRILARRTTRGTSEHRLVTERLAEVDRLSAERREEVASRNRLDVLRSRYSEDGRRRRAVEREAMAQAKARQEVDRARQAVTLDGRGVPIRPDVEPPDPAQAQAQARKWVAELNASAEAREVEELAALERRFGH